MTAALASGANDAHTYWYRGAAHAALRNYHAALADYNDAIIRLNPQSAALYGFRADTYHQLGSFEEAVADYSHMLILDGNALDAYYRRGKSYFQLGEYAAVLADWRHVTALQNNEPWLTIYRGVAYAELHKFTEAKQALQQSSVSKTGDDLYQLATLLVEVGHTFQTETARVFIAKDEKGKTVYLTSLSLFAARYAIPAIASR